jgi:hypothetical protein
MVAVSLPELPETPRTGTPDIPELPAPPSGGGRNGKRKPGNANAEQGLEQTAPRIRAHEKAAAAGGGARPEGQLMRKPKPDKAPTKPNVMQVQGDPAKRDELLAGLAAEGLFTN